MKWKKLIANKYKEGTLFDCWAISFHCHISIAKISFEYARDYYHLWYGDNTPGHPHSSDPSGQSLFPLHFCMMYTHSPVWHSHSILLHLDDGEPSNAAPIVKVHESE